MFCKMHESSRRTLEGEGVSEVLRVEELCVSYGAIQALRGVSLHIAAGETVAVVGANGAGKTTLLKALSNVLPARSGRVHYKGSPIGGIPAYRLVREGLLHVTEGRGIFGDMTVLENLLLMSYAGVPNKEMDVALERVFTHFPQLSERRRQVASSLSGGQQQMLSIGRSLMVKPQLLMLDEPSLGLSPKLVHEIFDALAQIKEQGVTILLVEQNARKALEIADRGYVLSQGRVAMEGLGRDLIKNESVLKAYLGA